MTELNDLRGEIDRIDGELTALFARRMEVSARIARCKAERGLPVLDASREAEKLQSIAEMLPPELREDDGIRIPAQDIRSVQHVITSVGSHFSTGYLACQGIFFIRIPHIREICD